MEDLPLVIAALLGSAYLICFLAEVLLRLLDHDSSR